MKEANLVQLVALIGWLILVGGAYASFRLSWRKSFLYIFAWLAIFVGVYLVFSVVAPS